MNRDEERFIQQTRASLDQSEGDISPHVAARLRQARHAAIASRYRRATPFWLPAMATAMLLIVVAITWFGGTTQVDGPTTLPVQQATNDFEMLVHGEDLALFADLDFYLWLEHKDKDAG